MGGARALAGHTLQRTKSGLHWWARMVFDGGLGPDSSCIVFCAGCGLAFLAGLAGLGIAFFWGFGLGHGCKQSSSGSSGSGAGRFGRFGMAFTAVFRAVGHLRTSTCWPAVVVLAACSVLTVKASRSARSVPGNSGNLWTIILKTTILPQCWYAYSRRFPMMT